MEDTFKETAEGITVTDLLVVLQISFHRADDASILMSLARSRDGEILQAFEGCFDGDEYKGEIDDDLFLAQVGFRSLGWSLIRAKQSNLRVRCTTVECTGSERETAREIATGVMLQLLR